MLGFCCAGSSANDSFKLPLQLQVNGGSFTRTDALCYLVVPNEVGTREMRLIETTSGNPSDVAVQFDASSKRLYWVATGTTKPAEIRSYRLEQGTSPESNIIRVFDSEHSVEATYKGKSLLQYNKAHRTPPADLDPKYGRSGHLHPVRTPAGAVVTDEFPPDHAHQSGIFFAYTRAKFEGRNVDFWNLAGGKGRVRFKKLMGVSNGPVFGTIRTEHEHIDLTAEDSKSNDDGVTGGKVALVENWEVRIWPAGWNSGYWLLDITSKIRCATESPLQLPEYHYGGIALRAARNWTPPLPKVLTSEGADRLRGNHTRPRWCDFTGPVADRPAGIALMTHTENFRFPEPLRIHPTMPYMVYAPQYLGAWELQPNRTYASRYRFVIHDGEMPGEKLDHLWQNYAVPLKAQVQ
jgi:hypothetical protein